MNEWMNERNEFESFGFDSSNAFFISKKGDFTIIFSVTIRDALRHLVPFVKLKNVKNTSWWVLLLVKLQAKACNFTESNTPPWVFFTFFKLYEWYQITQSITHIYLYMRRAHLVGKWAFSCQSTRQIPNKKILYCYKIMMIVIKNHLQGGQKYCHQQWLHSFYISIK